MSLPALGKNVGTPHDRASTAADVLCTNKCWKNRGHEKSSPHGPAVDGRASRPGEGTARPRDTSRALRKGWTSVPGPGQPRTCRCSVTPLAGTCASVLGRLSAIGFWNIFRELEGESPWLGLIHIGVGALTPPCRSWQLDSSAQESLLPGRFPPFRGGPVLLLPCHRDRFPHLRGGQSLPYMTSSNQFPYSRGGCGLPFVAHSRRFPHYWGGEDLIWFPSTGR